MIQEELKKLLKRYGLEPNKTYGQNFLLDENILTSIVESAGVTSEDVVLEVGPGIGNLTSMLALKAKQVLCVEKDTQFKPLLNALEKKHDNLKVVYEDILDFDFVSELQKMHKEYLCHCDLSVVALPVRHSLSERGAKSEESATWQSQHNCIALDCHAPKRARNDRNYLKLHYKVVANLPYYLTGAAFQLFLRTVQVRPSSITVLIQKEVAENVVAKPGKTNLLSLSVQLLGLPRIVQIVPSTSFFPPPKVTSAVLHIDVPTKSLYIDVDEKMFFQVARACFSGKRKQIHNSLASGFNFSQDKTLKILKSVGVAETERPQRLSVQDFINLSKAVEAAL